MKIYEIPENKLIDLMIAEARLEALEAGGVDNWMWYCESLWEGIDDTKYDLPNEYFEEEAYKQLKNLKYREVKDNDT